MVNVAPAIVETNNGRGFPALTQAQLDYIKLSEIAQHNKDVANLIRPLDPTTGEPRENGDQVDIPERSAPYLPEWAKLPQGMGVTAGKWIDLYIDYAMAVSPMTPRLFHESAALWLVSAAIARRVVVPLSYTDVYPNLFVIWLAPTSVYKKSTGLDIARKISRTIFPYLMAPNETTTEALLSDMAGYQPQNLNTMSLPEQQRWEQSRNFAAQKGLVYDEISGLMAGAGKDYNAGLLEAFLRFYDCDPDFERSSRAQGRVYVKNSYLSILGASTPSAMASHLRAERLWGNGWWGRFGILTPENPPIWAEPKQIERPAEIIEPIRVLMERLPVTKHPECPRAIPTGFGTGAFEAWQKYTRAVTFDLLIPQDINQKLHGTYSRLPTNALKIAMILAVLDWQTGEPSPRIELPHIARAIEIAESWRSSAHRAIEASGITENDRVKERVIKQLSKTPSGFSVRELKRLMSDVGQKMIEDALNDLLRSGEAIEVPTSGNGRHTVRYALSVE